MTTLTKFLRLFFISIGINIIFSILFSLFSAHFFKSLIDYSFFFSLISLTVGASLFVIEGGFFNGIRYSFKKLRKSSKEGEYIASFDHLDDTKEIYEEYPKQRVFTWTYPLLAGGGVIALATLIIAFIIS
ncbi:DUF3899 domain-containing protein [Bacillus sp. FJAT-52991]|uniref:DUF3899 domain-containing protein n=1 Tax=Bacillus kandeliae TaxID=3129297 RepID=A0ABZ2N9G9_9BACI